MKDGQRGSAATLDAAGDCVRKCTGDLQALLDSLTGYNATKAVFMGKLQVALQQVGPEGGAQQAP